MKEFLKSYKYVILSVVLCLLLVFTNGLSIKQCNRYKDINNNNIVALTDTIKYYKTKNNEIYVSKTLLEGNLKTLELANDSLYNVIKEMKLKNPTSIVNVSTTIDNKEKDTIWVIDNNNVTVNPRLSHNFDFSNKYRELTGNVFLEDSILGLNIKKDKVFLNYTMAIEDNKVYIKSDNPYIQYNNIQGLTITQPKRRKATLVFGPSINVGYDFNSKETKTTLGLSLTYGIDLINLIKK